LPQPLVFSTLAYSVRKCPPWRQLWAEAFLWAAHPSTGQSYHGQAACFAVLRCFFSRLRDPTRESSREKNTGFWTSLPSPCVAVIAGADDWPKVVAFCATATRVVEEFPGLAQRPCRPALPWRGSSSCSSPRRCNAGFPCAGSSKRFDGEEDKHLAIDGKTLRGLGEGGVTAEHPLHMVSVWATRSGLCLGTTGRLPRNPMRLPAVPVLAEVDRRQRCLGDAWTPWVVQREIAAAIIAGGGPLWS